MLAVARLMACTVNDSNEQPYSCFTDLLHCGGGDGGGGDWRSRCLVVDGSMLGERTVGAV